MSQEGLNALFLGHEPLSSVSKTINKSRSLVALECLVFGSQRLVSFISVNGVTLDHTRWCTGGDRPLGPKGLVREGRLKSVFPRDKGLGFHRIQKGGKDRCPQGTLCRLLSPSETDPVRPDSF